jgi:hypothetical protein
MSAERVLDLFTHELARSALIYIGRAQPRGSFFTRVLQLVNDPASRRLGRHGAPEARLPPPYPPPAAAT